MPSKGIDNESEYLLLQLLRLPRVLGEKLININSGQTSQPGSVSFQMLLVMCWGGGMSGNMAKRQHEVLVGMEIKEWRVSLK